MSDVTDLQFDLTPPSQEQLRELARNLSEDERQVLLEHGTEAPFCGIFLTEKRRSLYVPVVRPAIVQGGCEVREWHWMAEFHCALRHESSPQHSRHQLWHGQNGNRLRPMRCASGTCLSRRPAADRAALLHQLCLACLYPERPASARQAWEGRSRGRSVEKLRRARPISGPTRSVAAHPRSHRILRRSAWPRRRKERQGPWPRSLSKQSAREALGRPTSGQGKAGAIAAAQRRQYRRARARDTRR